MMLTSRLGLLIRAVITLVIGFGVFVGSTLVAGVVVWTLLSLYTGGMPVYQTVGVAAAVAAVVFLWVAQETIQNERSALMEGTVDAADATVGTDVEALCSRVAAGMGIDDVDCRIRESTETLAYTTYRSDDPVVFTGSTTPVVVVSEGVVDALDTEELQAVLAHELAHLANDDLRLITWAMTPLVAAETVHRDDQTVSSVFDLLAVLTRWRSFRRRGFGRRRGRIIGSIAVNIGRNLVVFTGHLLAVIASVGIGVFSRGREVAADRAAATELGRPGPLVSALKELDDSAPLTTDLRTRRQSTSAVNILPTTGGGQLSRLQRSHPPLESRIDALQALASE